MKEINFRIIELESHQVLLSKDFEDNNNEEVDLLVVTFFHDGLKINQSLGFSNEKKRDDAFNSFSNELAQKHVTDVIKMFE